MSNISFMIKCSAEEVEDVKDFTDKLTELAGNIAIALRLNEDEIEDVHVLFDEEEGNWNIVFPTRFNFMLTVDSLIKFVSRLLTLVAIDEKGINYESDFFQRRFGIARTE